MQKLTKKEKHIIQQINLPPYSADYCEEWLNREKENIFINAPAALQQLCVEVFVDVVRKIAKQGIRRTNEEYTITDSVTVGDSELVIAELTDPTTQQMYVTWECPHEADTPSRAEYYYRGDYTTSRHAALRSLIRRIEEKIQRQYPDEDAAYRFPELSKYDEGKQYVMPRPCAGFAIEYLERYEIVFRIANKRYSCFANAVSKDEALGQFFREHPHIPFGMITEVQEV